MDTARLIDVNRAFVGLADTLVADFDVIDLLQQLVDHCTDLLGVSAAGLLLSDQRGGLRVAAASSERMRLLELFQLQTDVGPCLEAFAAGETVVTYDEEDQLRRWPVFTQEMRLHGFRTVVAVPLRLRDTRIGALGLFDTRAEPMGPDDVGLVQALADIATIGVLHDRALRSAEQLTGQLQGALNSRIVIEQAKGVIAATGDVDVVTAFEQVRAYARRRGLKLADVSLAIVRRELTAVDLQAPGPGPSGRR